MLVPRGYLGRSLFHSLANRSPIASIPRRHTLHHADARAAAAPPAGDELPDDIPEGQEAVRIRADDNERIVLVKTSLLEAKAAAVWLLVVVLDTQARRSRRRWRWRWRCTAGLRAVNSARAAQAAIASLAPALAEIVVVAAQPDSVPALGTPGVFALCASLPFAIRNELLRLSAWVPNTSGRLPHGGGSRSVGVRPERRARCLQEPPQEPRRCQPRSKKRVWSRQCR